MNRSGPIKERFKQSRGRSVPEDYFLYSCLEFERGLQPGKTKGGETPAAPASFQSEGHWPGLSDIPEVGPEIEISREVIVQNFKDTLLDLVAWYAAHYPEMASSAPVDHERLSEVVKPVVYLGADLSKACTKVTGQPLPEFDANGNVNGEGVAIWQSIESYLAKYFPNNFGLFLRFYQWSHAAEKPQIEEDAGSRPPVGMFAAWGRRPSGGGGNRGQRFDSRGGGGGRGGRDRPERGNERGGGGNFRGNDRGGGDRGFNRDGGRDGRSGHRGRGGRDGRHFNDNGGGNRPPPEVLEAQARQDVSLAIEQLQGDPNLSEVPLRPVNSFYRRLQHEQAKEAGMSSYSNGEGMDRAVVICRGTPPGASE